MDPEQEKQSQDAPQEGAPAEQVPAEPTPEVPQESVDEADTPLPDDSTKKLIITIVLAVIVVVLALMYMWGARIIPGTPVEEPAPEVPVPAEPEPVAQPEPTPESDPLSTSDEVSALEADLDMPELESLDSDLVDMEAELDQMLEEL